MKRILFLLCVAMPATVSTVLGQIPMATATATLGSFSGTYTFHLGQLRGYTLEYNLTGQQVGFCNGSVPAGYFCQENYTFDLLEGRIVADGAGHITSGSFAITPDPNSYECSPNNHPTIPCPVVVPAGDPYSMTAAYNVGAAVDFTAGAVTRTFQAVRKNTGKPPNWTTTAGAANICTYNNLNTCYWTQIPVSQTAKNNNISGTLVGSYTIQANASGVMTVTPSCGTCGAGSVEFSIILPPVSQIGQTVSLIGISQLGRNQKNQSVGSAVRIQ